MKRLITFFCMMLVVFSTFAQKSRVHVPDALKKVAIERKAPTSEVYNFQAGLPTMHFLKSPSQIDETIIGNSRYDLQSNACTQNRLFLHNDGTMGGTWTFGLLDPGFTDRGTGYNYFNGTAWGPNPTSRIETIRTGWPSYAPWGANGEIVVAHTTGTGTLRISTRATKGTGAWTDQAFIAPPTGASGLLWPRMVTSGPDNNIIHIIALTTPTGNGGVVYQGMNGALLYFRSSNGGTTWDIPGIILPGMDATFYTGIGGDVYTWIQPRGNKIAFLVGDNDIDLFMMVSNDNGDNWEKVMIWQNPYKGLTNTPMYYCSDGSFHGAIDNGGKVHVVFGLNASRGEGGSFYWYPFIGGIAYWNTDMPGWINGDSATLDPDNLEASGHLIGYALDLNNNGQWDLVGTTTSSIGLYYLGSSSMPQIIVDNNNVLFMVYSSVTEGYDNGIQNYRHLFARTSPDGGYTWGDFHHLTEDILHMFDECVFSSAAANSNNYFHILYQADEEPGLAVRGDNDPYGDNYLYHMAIEKDFVVGSNNGKPEIKTFVVSQNYPNPVNGFTRFTLELDRQSDVSVSLFNLAGQQVMQIDKGTYNKGKHSIELDLRGLNSGLYFYTVQSGSQTVTRKLVVR